MIMRVFVKFLPLHRVSYRRLAAISATVATACCADDASDLQDFLRSCNPRQQLSGTFESYLIKPIQRILKYPLLLRQLMDLTEAYTDEHRHLAGETTASRAAGERQRFVTARSELRNVLFLTLSVTFFVCV